MIAFIHPASLDHRRRGGRHGRRPVDLVSGAGRTVAGAGEVNATRLDIATRVDGRVAEIPVERGQKVWCVLVKIDNRKRLLRTRWPPISSPQGAVRQYQRRYPRRGDRDAQASVLVLPRGVARVTLDAQASAGAGRLDSEIRDGAGITAQHQ